MILPVNVETIKHSLITTSLQTHLNAGRSTRFVHLCEFTTGTKAIFKVYLKRK